jgi:hypothetical protein
MTAGQLADLELVYAPPFSSAKDPVNLLGYMAENILSGDCDVVAPHELGGLVEEGWSTVDVRTREEHEHEAAEGSMNVPIDSLRDRLDALGRGLVVVYCEGGQRGHTATACFMSSDSRHAILMVATRLGWRRCEVKPRYRLSQFRSDTSDSA